MYVFPKVYEEAGIASVEEHAKGSQHDRLYQPVQGLTYPPVLGQKIKPTSCSSPTKIPSISRKSHYSGQDILSRNDFPNYYRCAYVVAFLHDRKANARIRIDGQLQVLASGRDIFLEGSPRSISDYSLPSFPE